MEPEEVAVIGYLWVNAAFAGAASAVILEPGAVVGTVTVKATVEEVRSRVSDPRWVAATDNNGTRVTLVGRDGDCLLFDAVSPNVVMDAQYSTRHCPTADGSVSTLRASNTFTSYATSWRVTAEGDSTRIEYRLTMTASIALPQYFVDNMLENRVLGMMTKIGAALDG